jgi:hypothetical protein
MGMRRIDFFCFMAALFFVISGVFRTVLFGRNVKTTKSDWTLLKAMDGTYLKQEWKEIDGLLEFLRVAHGLVHVLAWCITTTVLFRAAWIQSSKGTKNVGLHASIAFLGAAIAVVELIVRLISHGSAMALQFMATDFNMENWYEIDGLAQGQQDQIGWKVLEVLTTAGKGMLLWVDTIEYFLLATILVLLFVSTKGQASPLSTSWSCFGLGIAFLCILDIVAEILRFTSWNTFVQLSFWISTANRIVFFPNWILWLGVQLAAVPNAAMKQDSVVNMQDDELE